MTRFASARFTHRALSSRAKTLAAASVAAVALAACSEQPVPAEIAPHDPNAIVICGDGCGGGGPPPAGPISVSALTLTSDTLSIAVFNEGAFVATIANSGQAQSNVTTQLTVIQGNTRHPQFLPAKTLSCGSGDGVLPRGGCQVSGAPSAINFAGVTPALVPGAATVEFAVTVGGTTYTQAKSVVLEPGIEGVTSFQGLSMHGNPFRTQSAVISTATAPIANLSIRIQVKQGLASRVVANAPLACGASIPSGTLPAQSRCVTPVTLVLSNTTPGPGTIVPGSADVLWQLVQGSTVLQTRHWSTVVLAAFITTPPTFAAPLVIDGPGKTYTATLTNNGTPISFATLNSYLLQGATRRDLSPHSVVCGGSQALPNGTCTINGVATVSSTARGNGTLVPGSATAVFVLADFTGDVADTVLVPVTLASNAPPTMPPPTAPAASIGTVTISTAATIGAPGPTPIAIAVGNTGGTLTNASLRMMVLQGSSERYATNGSQAFDCGSGTGVVPSGGCTINTSFFVSNTSPGTGSFSAGAAKLIIYVVDPANAIISTKTVPVTLAQ